MNIIDVELLVKTKLSYRELTILSAKAAGIELEEYNNGLLYQKNKVEYKPLVSTHDAMMIASFFEYDHRIYD